MALRKPETDPTAGRPIVKPARVLSQWPLLAPLPIYALLAIVVFRDAWRSPASIVAGYGQDPAFFMWCFRWFPFALSHGLDPFVTHYLDYPGGMNLLASTSAPLLSLVLWPVTSIWGPLVAYNLAVTGGVVASAWCAFLLCSRIVRSRIAAAIGGALYGFSPFMMAHALGHPHLVVAIFPPLLGLLAFKLLARESNAPLWVGALLGLVLTAQFFVSEEMFAMEVFAAIVAVGLGVALFPDQWQSRLRLCIRPLAIGTAICVGLAAIPAGIQFFGPQHVAGTVNPGGFYVSDLLGFVIPTQLQWLSPGPALQISQRFTGNLEEWTAYLGLPLLLVPAYVTVSAWRRPVVRLLAMMCGLFMLLSLGPTLHLGGIISPIPSLILGVAVIPLRRHFKVVPLLVVLIGSWAVLAVIPVIDNILPGRLMILVFLLLGVLLAVFIDSIPPLPVAKRIAGFVMAAAALAFLVPSLSMPATAYAVPEFFQRPSAQQISGARVVLVAPYAYEWDDLAMLWQSTRGMSFRMPEGYGTIPGPRLNPPRTALGDWMIALDQGGPYHAMSQHARARLLTDLRSWRVDAVVVGPMSNQPAMVRFMTDLIGYPPETTGGVYLWRTLTIP